MNMMTLRDRLLPERTLWSSILFSLAAVVAIVAGLLAMHSLNLETTGEAVHASAAMTAPHHSVAASVATPGESVGQPCGDPCMPQHSMTAMACVLALLVSALIMGIACTYSSRAPSMLWVLLSLNHPAAIRLPDPPSLHALGISRT